MELHVIIGRLDYDVRAGKTQSNKDFTAFTLVVEKEYQGKKFTSYPQFTAWGETSKVAARLGKGDIVQVFSQEAKAKSYESKRDNTTKYSVEYTVRDLQVIARGGAAPAQQPQQQARPTPPPAAKPQDNQDEDVPF